MLAEREKKNKTIKLLKYIKMMECFLSNVWIVCRILLNIPVTIVYVKISLTKKVDEILHSVHNVMRNVEWIGYGFY